MPRAGCLGENLAILSSTSVVNAADSRSAPTRGFCVTFTDPLRAAESSSGCQCGGNVELPICEEKNKIYFYQRG